MQKLFTGLSNKAWGFGLDLIQHITKRGGAHNFRATEPAFHHLPITTASAKALELNELGALALALEWEKLLSAKAHALHELYSRHHASAAHNQYDPEVAHYLDEKFIGGQAATVRKLSGYTNDLKRLQKEQSATQTDSLNLYLFDEYLEKEE